MANNSLSCLIVLAALSLPIAAQHGDTQDRPYPGSDQNTNTDVRGSSPSDNSSPASQDQSKGSMQGQNSTATSAAQNSDQDDQNTNRFPAYRVQVVERTTQAVDYRDRGGTTQVDFRGTTIMPPVTGDAHVTGHTGRLAINVALHHLGSPRTFGPEYLTYVLWAITPEGRPANLGEVIPSDDGDSKVQVTTGLQEFGMIVTAEPYFAVTRPSDLVVAENIVRNDTAGGVHPITARYELLQKGQYLVDVTPDQLPATTADRHVPLQLLEAENAIAIARAGGADQYAPETVQKAQEYLNQAQDYYRRKQGITPIGAVARASAQTAEDARLMTLEKKQQERAAAERQRAQERIQSAQSEADANAVRADEARLEAQHQGEARALADQERQAAEQARVQAEQAAQEAAQERAAAQQQLQQSEQGRQAALQQQQTYAQQAELARQQAQQSEQARLQTEQQAQEQRQRLLNQLNQVLQTRESARGLIVNMSDVLFDVNRSTLKPGAKLRLAKVAGIILAYPDLKLEIDGFTDSTGSSDYNQTLSEKRAQAVDDFLVQQGVQSSNISSRGYGQANPVASNATATGRQQNRRVELVVNGTSIGLNQGQGNAVGNRGGYNPAPGAAGSAPQGGQPVVSPYFAPNANGSTTSPPNTNSSGSGSSSPAPYSSNPNPYPANPNSYPSNPNAAPASSNPNTAPPAPAQTPMNSPGSTPVQTQPPAPADNGTPPSAAPATSNPPQPSNTPPQQQ